MDPIRVGSGLAEQVVQVLREGALLLAFGFALARQRVEVEVGVGDFITPQELAETLLEVQGNAVVEPHAFDAGQLGRRGGPSKRQLTRGKLGQDRVRLVARELLE